MKPTLIKLYIVLLLLWLPAVKTFAQESILNDVSYPFLQKLISTAKETNPLAKIKASQLKNAETTYKASKYTWFEALSMSYVYNPQNQINLNSLNQSTTTSSGTATTTGSSTTPNLFGGYQISLNLNLGTLIRNPFTTKIAKENVTIAQLEQESYNLTIEAEVKRRYFAYLQQIASLKIRTKNAQESENLLTESKNQFEKGIQTLDAFIKASTSFSELNQAKIDAEIAMLTAKASLEELVGKKLEEVK